MALTFVCINGVGFGSVDAEPDAFTWWAQIWIPGVVGIATLVSTFVALWISHRATLLAKAVEDQRQLAENARDIRDAKDRLQLMAVEEARAVTRWVNVAARDSHWERRKLHEIGEVRHGPTLLAEARVLLQQSLVPAAEELFEVTELEVRAFRMHLPDAMYMPDRRIGIGGINATSDLLAAAVLYRRDRTLARIRGWALDPQGAHQEVLNDLSRAESTPDAFWDYRLGIGSIAQELRPLSDLKRPPGRTQERTQFLTERGLLPTDG